ncbi:MAG: hypothetical protein ACI92S_002744, partial [Planctomycetaceae bacterium]
CVWPRLQSQDRTATIQVIWPAPAAVQADFQKFREDI